MPDTTIPAPINEFIEATNAADSERFVDAFTDDAYLNDWGREFHGRDGARSWNGSDNIGKQSHFDFIDITPGENADSYTVTMKVSGNGFNGNSPFAFVLRDGKIAEMRITP